MKRGICLEDRTLERSRRFFLMTAGHRFYVQNFGCRATQADGAGIAAALAAKGLHQMDTPSAAELVIVNTCTVTSEADQDARQTIRRIHRENPQARILVTGCYAQRRPAELAKLPGVRWVVGNSHKTAIADIVTPKLVNISPGAEPAELTYHGEIVAGRILVGDICDQTKFLSYPVVAAGQDRTRPNLKIQDGCNNRCTFCIIPSVRGNSRSARPEQVIDQVGSLAARYKEIVLTGINLGHWGRDLPGRPRLVDLLRRLLGETAVAKLRLSSVEPMDWSDDLLALMASSDRICKHVHIPLQSASDRILKAMRRRYRVRHYAGRLERARRLMRWASIGADVMVGFPGETERDFAATRQFVTDMPFTYLHVFPYSTRPGTTAAEHGDQVPSAVKKERGRILRELIASKNLAFRRSLVGRSFSAVTLDSRDEPGTRALTDNYIPVTIDGERLDPGRLVEIEITRCREQSTSVRLRRQLPL